MMLTKLFAAILLILMYTHPASPAETTSVPLIHCTDIFFPPDDPDDYFDLASIYATPEFDLKLVVLDQGQKQKERPGRLAVEQMNTITGRDVPCVIGLNEKLGSTTDTALSQPAEFQGGVDAILDVLRDSETSVVISVVGSARDMAAAYNREPQLLRSRVKKIYVFCGEASNPDFTEYNVDLDRLAFAALMRSGLNICWIPCFDGGLWKNGGHASFWQAKQGELLHSAPDPLLQYFISATQSVTSSPMEFLKRPVDRAHKEALFATPRNMWGGALLSLMAGRQLVQTDGHWRVAQPDQMQPQSPQVAGALADFPDVQVQFNDDGVASYGSGNHMQRIHVRDVVRYGPALIEATAKLLGSLSVSKDLRDVGGDGKP